MQLANIALNPQCKTIRIPGQRNPKYVCLKHLEILGFAIQNPNLEIRNPGSNSSTDKDSRLSNSWNPESKKWNSESKSVYHKNKTMNFEVKGEQPATKYI